MTPTGSSDGGTDSGPISATATLDTTREAGETLAPEASASDSACARGRVLIIDDEAAIVRVLVRALENFHEVIAVASGREALDRIAAGERFDTILCDVRMAEISGVEVHAGLMTMAPDQANRMIFMTGDGLSGAGWASLDRLRLPILEKPFPLQLLRLLIDKHIGSR